jgi:hypothetical protein
MVDLLPGKELDLFFEGIDQPDVFRAAFDHLAGVGEEGNDDRFAVDADGFLPELTENPGVAGMDAVKSAYSNY